MHVTTCYVPTRPARCLSTRTRPTRIRFDWYHNNDIASQALHYNERSIDAVLQLFCANRTAMAQLLAQVEDVESKYILINATTDPSIEPELVYVPHIVELLTEHVLVHVAEIQRLRNS